MLKRKQQKAAANQIQPKTICQPLNDAVVQQIFSHLPVRARAKFGEVSKQWNVISRKPALWAACEIAFKSRADRDVKRKKDINSTRHLISLAAFLNKYCTALHDLHLSYDHHDDMASDRLDAFFQIKSLRRMKVLEFSPHEEKQAYIPSKLPACSNLELLNTDLYISVEAAKKLFQGLPNLKELYVPYARISLFNHKDVFSLAKKLERVALKYYSMPPALLVKTCPSLRFIMYYRRWYAKDTDSDTDEEEPIEVIGNTVAVRPEGFEDDSLRENYKLLAPILVPYLHNQPSMSFLAALASNYYFNKKIIKYLVKEKNWDLHYECPEYTYRESFQWHTSSFFSERMKFKFPLDAAIQGLWRDVESVQELMELGAYAECPKEDYSYLTQATRADVRLLLLKHGADPNKMVEFDMNYRNFRVGFGMKNSMIQVPAFVFHFVDAKFEDSEEFVMALKDRVDFNVEVLSKTMLEWALEHKKWNTIYALLKLGVKKISRDWSMAISYALTNGKVDEAKIRQTQLTIKAQQEAEARQRQEIYDRMRKNMAAAPVVQPWVIGSDDESNSSDESDSENRLWWSNSDSDEHEHRSFFKNMSSDESHEPFFEEFSEDNESEVEESEAEEESEESEEDNTNVRDQLPAKLQRLYDALVGVQKIIQDLDSFSVKAFQKQLTRDIFPAYISNTKRKQQLKSATDQAESKDLFKALLKQWIDHFLTEFHHEIASMASK